MIVAIDGPAGSGKSSTARAVAARLGFHHLDSGALYRALTWAAMDAGIRPDAWPDLDRPALDALDVEARFRGDELELRARGQDVGQAVRGPEVTANVSRMARIGSVRDWVNERLRDVARAEDVVADGRDIGTVVFPHADVKVFLVAAPETRARRRLAEQGATTPDADAVRAEVERLLERDRMDSARAIAPLRRAEDAVVVDTTPLSFEEQVDVIAELVRSRRPPS